MVDIVKVGLSVDSREVDKGTKSLDKLGKQGGKTQKATDKMSGSFKLLGSVIAAIGLSRLIGHVISTAAAFEKMEASLVTVTGSMENASMAMRGITEFATETPYQVEEITQAFIKLKSLGISPTEERLRSFGNTSSAMGKSLNQMIEAVADAATGEFERLKEFGIKSRSEGENVKFTFNGITTTVRKNAEEITGYLEGIGETQFAGAMEKQMDTLDGAFSNFNDSVSLAIKKLSEDSGFNELIKEATIGAASFIRQISGTKTVSDLEQNIADTKERIKELQDQVDKSEEKGVIARFFDGSAAAGTYLKEQREMLKQFTEELRIAKELSDKGGLDEAGKKTPEQIAAEEAAKNEAIYEAETDRLFAQIELDDAALEYKLEYNEKKLAADQDYYDRLYDMQAGSQQAALDFSNAMRNNDLKSAIGHGSAMLSNAAKQNKAAFEIQKAFALANAVATLPGAVIKSFDNGGGYPWGLIPAGLMLAQGLQQINSIKSSTFGGGATPSSVSGGGSTSPSAPVASGLPPGSTATPEATEQPTAREIRVTVEGDGPHSDGMRKFAENLAETIKDMGGVGSLVIS